MRISTYLITIQADAPLAFSDDDISDGGFAQDDVDDDDIW